MPAVHLSGDINITYVQIPKTAGTSIGHWLIDHKRTSVHKEWYNHPTLEEINSAIDKNFSFTVVRNPWDRIVSAYYFLQHWVSPDPRSHSDQNKKLIYEINNYKNNQFPEFNTWIENLGDFKCLPWLKWNMFTPQTAWCNVDLILKYEDLDNEFLKIQDIFNNYDPLPVSNITRGIYWTNYKDLYNDKSKNIIGKLFEEEIDLWGYTF